MVIPDRGKSIFSAIFMVGFALFLILALIFSWLPISVTFLLIAVICLIVAGFPWGITIFAPFWFGTLGGLHFSVVCFSGIWFIISLIIDVIFFVAKWIVFFGLCIVIGWINMFIHTGTIIRNVRSLGIFQKS